MATTADTLNAMTDTEYRVFENRMRRAAKRQGLMLLKARSRDPRALDYGCYTLVDGRNNFVVAGADTGRASMGLDDVEAYLTQDGVA